MIDDVERRRLEAERDFLLRSLDDLENERDDGAIDDDTFSVLHADYTARAAAATRALTGTVDATDASPNGEEPHSRRLLTVAMLGILVCMIAMIVLFALAPRQPGETITGNNLDGPTPPGPTATSFDTKAEFDRLAAAVQAAPESAEARLDFGLFLFQGAQYGPAVEQLREAVRLAPDNVEAQAFYGWGVWQLAGQAPEGDGRDQLIDIAADHLTTALDLSPDDVSANTFLGIVLLRGKNDPVAAIPFLERAVELTGGAAPPMLGAALEEARAAATTVPRSTTPASPTPSTES